MQKYKAIGLWAILLILFNYPVFAQSPPARTIHFTVDGKEGSTSLVPNFSLHTSWSALGKASNGNIYIGVSNHIYSQGNVAMFKYVPGDTKMTFLNDLKSVSKGVNNWMTNESQFKVHTFLMEHADGKMYFFTLDYEPTQFLRGAHLYYIDPVTDAIVDYSKTQPFVMKRDFTMIPNTGALSDTSGVFSQFYGIKGMGLNKNAPDYIYGMTYHVSTDSTVPDNPGYVLQHNLKDGTIKKVGVSYGVSYVFYVDNNGNAYYASNNGNNKLDLMKYDVAQDTVKTVSNDFIDVRIEYSGGKRKTYNNGFGMVAPTAGGDTVYIITNAGHNHGVSHLYRLICSTDSFELLTTLCGTYFWKIFNLSLSPNGKRLFYVSVGALSEDEALYSIDLTKNPPVCTRHYNILSVTGNRDVCFGGINIWDNNNNFYAPTWTYSNTRVALLKVNTDPQNLPIARKDVAELQKARGPLIFPNPFKYITEIEFFLPEPQQVELAVYDLQGIKITSLYNGTLDTETYVFHWDGRNVHGISVPSGVYLIVLNGNALGKVFYKNN